jgi:2-polyprenyl-3-methyl-5-hydroxy-6-metoxy-1,4-benzoquinol methylase
VVDRVIRPITPSGLHEFVGEFVLSRVARPGVNAVDLGTGYGAMAERLQNMGCKVLAADLSSDGFEAKVPHIVINFDQPDFASSMGVNSFDIVTAIEVIEHVESPIGFLRNVRLLLSPAGVAVLTTPNVDCLPARIKHLLYGKIRSMDEQSEPTHISPIFFDLFERQFLRVSKLQLQQHLLFPPSGFQNCRKSVALFMGVAARLFPGESTVGDHHVFVLKASN